MLFRSGEPESTAVCDGRVPVDRRTWRRRPDLRATCPRHVARWGPVPHRAGVQECLVVATACDAHALPSSFSLFLAALSGLHFRLREHGASSRRNLKPTLSWEQGNLPPRSTPRIHHHALYTSSASRRPHPPHRPASSHSSTLSLDFKATTSLPRTAQTRRSLRRSWRTMRGGH